MFYPSRRCSFTAFAFGCVTCAIACGGSTVPSEPQGTPAPDRGAQDAAGGHARAPKADSKHADGGVSGEYFNLTIGADVHTIVAKRAMTAGIDGGQAMVLASGFEKETADGASSTTVYFPLHASGTVSCDDHTRIEFIEAPGRVFSSLFLNRCTIDVVSTKDAISASFRGWIDNGSNPPAPPVMAQGTFRIVLGDLAH